MKSIATLMIKFYQKAISPLLGSNCRFSPTCSHYAIECFETFSFPQAVFKILIRILKCHPFHPGGYDPVIKDSHHSHCCKPKV